VVAECCEDLGEAMRAIDVAKLDPKEFLQTRGLVAIAVSDGEDAAATATTAGTPRLQPRRRGRRRYSHDGEDAAATATTARTPPPQPRRRGRRRYSRRFK
jgi:hypothetical protein